MEILLVHLSDIHIDAEFDIDIESVNKIASIIKQDSISCSCILFLITGDVANTGNSDEYLKAIDLITDLSGKSAKNKEKYVIICPGNHDKNLSNGRCHDDIVDGIVSRGEINKDEVDELNKYFSNFYDFRKIIEDEFSVHVEEHNLCVRYIISIGEEKICIDSYNTVLCAKRTCTQNSLFFPLNEMPNYSNADIKICLMHTTENWLTYKEKNIARRRFCNSYDMIFTGHEHEQFGYQAIDEYGDYVVKIEGGSLDIQRNQCDSNFSTVKINIEHKSKKNVYINSYFRNKDAIQFK